MQAFQRQQTAAPVSTAPADLQLPDTSPDCISSLKWSPQGCVKQMLACTAWDKTIRVYEVAATPGANNTVVPQAQGLGMQTGSQPLLSACFARDGRCFYGGCCKTAMMWNLPQGQQPQQVAAHDMPISCVRFAEDHGGQAGPLLITSGWDGRVRFWDCRQQAPAKEENWGLPILNFDVVGPMAAFATGRKVLLYNLQTMQGVSELHPPDAAKYQFTKVAIHKNQSSVVAGCVDGRLCGLPINGQGSSQFKAHGEENPRVKHDYEGYQINFVTTHPNNVTVITGGSDGYMRSFDIAQKQRFHNYAPKMVLNEALPISAGDLNAEGNLMAYAYSYDWALGRSGYDPKKPSAVMIKPFNPNDVRR